MQAELCFMNVCSAVHWMLGCHVELYFAAEYLKLVQLLAIVHLYWLAAARIFKKEDAVRRLIRSKSYYLPTIVNCLACHGA